MRSQRWIYVLLVVLGAALGLAIAGIPSRHYDPPLRVITTTTTTLGTTPQS